MKSTALLFLLLTHVSILSAQTICDNDNSYYDAREKSARTGAFIGTAGKMVFDLGVVLTVMEAGERKPGDGTSAALWTLLPLYGTGYSASMTGDIMAGIAASRASRSYNERTGVKKIRTFSWLYFGLGVGTRMPGCILFSASDFEWYSTDSIIASDAILISSSVRAAKLTRRIAHSIPPEEFEKSPVSLSVYPVFTHKTGGAQLILRF